MRCQKCLHVIYDVQEGCPECKLRAEVKEGGLSWRRAITVANRLQDDIKIFHTGIKASMVCTNRLWDYYEVVVQSNHGKFHYRGDLTRVQAERLVSKIDGKDLELNAKYWC